MSLQKEFQQTIKKDITKDLQLNNINACPRLEKIVINVGVGEAVKEKDQLDEVAKQIERITGQKSKICKAKKAISGFKIRKGLEIAIMVTLRGKKMYDFFERLVNVSLPRIRDFRGIKSKNFDSHGNLNLGIHEVIIFPEIDFDDLKNNFGLSVSIVTTTGDKKEAKALLEHLGMVFAGE